MTLEEYNAKKEIEARDKAAVEKQIRDSNVPPSEMPPVQPVVESNEPEAPTTMTEDVYTNAPSSNSAPMFSLSSYDQFYPQNMFENDTYVPSYEFPTYADKQIPTGQERLQYFQKAVEAGLIPGNFVTNDPKEIQRHNDIINAYARSNSSSGAPFNYSAGPIERKMGGSSGNYNAGDVVDMTPEEIQRFIQMGGQVEFLD